MPVALDPQLALDETAVTDPDLEAALERHLRAKQDQSEAAGVVKAAMADIERELAKHPKLTEDHAIRVGRFRLAIRHVEGGERSFTVEDRDQLTIGLLGDDGAPVRRAYRKRGSKADPVDSDVSPEPAGPGGE